MKRRVIYPVLFYGLVFLGCFNTPNAFSQSLSDEETMRVMRLAQSNKIAEMEELLRQETRGREEILTSNTVKFFQKQQKALYPYNQSH